MNYQIGTALVNGSEKLVLFSQSTYLDLSLLFDWPVLKRAAVIQDAEPPVSLMRMMEQWASWREMLPHMVDYFFAHPEENRSSIVMREEELQWLPPLLYPHKLICIGIDWVASKALDGFAPMGPLITPAEFVADPQDLRLTLSVNGQIKQNSTTANMVFSVQEIVEHLATVMTLEPGDVIATGTPAGVGFARKPQEFLQSGDYMVAEVQGLGRLETHVK